MAFNSFTFLVFFIVFFIVFWFILNGKTKLQNVLLLLASYIFYAWTDWKILPLLVISTLVFYVLGIAICKTDNDKRKNFYSVFGVVAGLAALGYFKYANFFITSFRALFDSIGLHTNLHTFAIIVPVGISFYTFRLLSYVIDIQRGKYEPTRDLVAFAAYVAFFPCILSGPIDRPNTLLPQLQHRRTFNYLLAVDGCRQILWGLFKKIAIADLLATYVNTVWDTYGEQTGSTLLIATLLFVFQMFADFSGYSDIAIGVGKLMGFRITQNFNSPLFAQNIADFWRKWHISLTQWLTDYVFMPLNIRWREWGNWGMILAILITFELIGLWHGSDWSFALFGLYHGLLYIPLILSGAMFQKIKIKTNIWGFPSIKVLGNMILTFALVAISFILFKADTIGDAVKYFWGMCNSSLFSIPYVYKREFYFPAIAGIIFMLIFEWNGKNDEFAIQKILSKWNPLFRYIFYFFLIFVICLLWGKDQIFIYFQF